MKKLLITAIILSSISTSQKAQIPVDINLAGLWICVSSLVVSGTYFWKKANTALENINLSLSESNPNDESSEQLERIKTTIKKGKRLIKGAGASLLIAGQLGQIPGELFHRNIKMILGSGWLIFASKYLYHAHKHIAYINKLICDNTTTTDTKMLESAQRALKAGSCFAGALILNGSLLAGQNIYLSATDSTQ